MRTDPCDQFFARKNPRYVGEGVEIHRWRVGDLWGLSTELPVKIIPVWKLHHLIKPHLWAYKDDKPGVIEAISEVMADFRVVTAETDIVDVMNTLQMLIEHVYRDVSHPGWALLSIVDHVDRVRALEPGWPILLSWEGEVMDGRHRLARALLEGEKEVRTQMFEPTPPPTHILRSDSMADYLQGEFEVIGE